MVHPPNLAEDFSIEVARQFICRWPALSQTLYNPQTIIFELNRPLVLFGRKENAIEHRGPLGMLRIFMTKMRREQRIVFWRGGLEESGGTGNAVAKGSVGLDVGHEQGALAPGQHRKRCGIP